MRKRIRRETKGSGKTRSQPAKRRRTKIEVPVRSKLVLGPSWRIHIEDMISLCRWGMMADKTFDHN